IHLPDYVISASAIRLVDTTFANLGHNGGFVYAIDEDGFPITNEHGENLLVGTTSGNGRCPILGTLTNNGQGGYMGEYTDGFDLLAIWVNTTDPGIFDFFNEDDGEDDEEDEDDNDDVDGPGTPGPGTPGSDTPGSDTPGSDSAEVASPPAPGIVEINDTSVPLAPAAPVELIEIVMLNDTPVPLAPFNPGEYETLILEDMPVPLAPFNPEEYETLILEDMPVPLSAMPQTGLADITGIMTTGLVLSALIAAATGKALRKMIAG
ncbi:MAG: hypothetical protein FWD98_04250, partial [Defluviitaleaceae bacterium]|nr:hypothetical protein [Defluviitaleaceae bacterium]